VDFIVSGGPDGPEHVPGDQPARRAVDPIQRLLLVIAVGVLVVAVGAALSAWFSYRSYTLNHDVQCAYVNANDGGQVDGITKAISDALDC
jgi:hypothetical protein